MDGVVVSGEYGPVSSSSDSSCISCTDHDSVVVLTTPPLPLTLRWTPAGASIGREESDRPAAGERRRWTQRELVLASLLRRPAGDRRGIVHRG
jgi:hypothetical protein